MKNLETTITIKASAKEVWNTLMDFKNYPEWNPFIQSIQGNPQIENKIEVQIGLGNKPMKFSPRVLENKQSTEFRWKGKLFIKGLFDGEHYFKLVENGPCESTFIHGEQFTGILSGLMMKMIGKDTKQGFIEMNEALKQEVEDNN